MELKFEKLEVWHLALSVIPVVYALLDKYPRKEQFNLVAQGRRSITSVALNIAEGHMRQSRKEFAQYVNVSLGSTVETLANLKIGINLGYISPEDFERTSSLFEKLFFKLIGLRKSLQKP
jgi:four helix bundle protein